AWIHAEKGAPPGSHRLPLVGQQDDLVNAWVHSSPRRWLSALVDRVRRRAHRRTHFPTGQALRRCEHPGAAVALALPPTIATARRTLRARRRSPSVGVQPPFAHRAKPTCAATRPESSASRVLGGRAWRLSLRGTGPSRVGVDPPRA